MQMQQILHTDEAHGVSVDWYSDGRVVVVNMSEPGRSSVDTLIDVMTDIVQFWPTDQPILMGLEVSENNLMTPYARVRLPQIASAIPQDMQGRLCLVIPKSIFGEAIMYFVTHDFQPLTPPSLLWRTFNNRDKAIMWLSDGLS